jgi:hypothetical protein
MSGNATRRRGQTVPAPFSLRLIGQGVAHRIDMTRRPTTRRPSSR